MTDTKPTDSTTPLPPSDAVIAQHVRNKEIEMRVRSHALAGLLMAVTVWLLATNYDFNVLGKHSELIAGAIAFVVGWWMGDRAVFAVLGGAVTYFFMRGGQNG